MTSKRLTLATFALLSAATVAHADATLTPLQGDVLVSKGQGFVRMTQPTGLKVGERAMVSQGSHGKITYPDGCAVDLRPGSVQIIGPVSPCAQAQLSPDRRTCDQTKNDDQRRQLGCDLPGYVTAGAVLALGATAAAVSLSEPNAGRGNGMSP